MASVSTVESAASSARPWFVAAFDRSWLKAYAHRNDFEAGRNAPSLARLLGLTAGDRVLDVGCGAGRYCRALAALGMRVTGVDLSRAMIEEASEKSPGLPGAPVYVRWDMRSLPFAGQFEAAISMFTSIGYFDDVEDDRRVLRGVARALVPGGRFLLDFLNAEKVRRGVESRTVRDVRGARILEERWIDEKAPAGPSVLKRVHLVNLATGREEASFLERVRLYGADEVDALLESSGLVPTGHRMGDVDGSPWSADAPRLVRVAERR